MYTGRLGWLDDRRNVSYQTSVPASIASKGGISFSHTSPCNQVSHGLKKIYIRECTRLRAHRAGARLVVWTGRQGSGHEASVVGMFEDDEVVEMNGFVRSPFCPFSMHVPC